MLSGKVGFHFMDYGNLVDVGDLYFELTGFGSPAIVKASGDFMTADAGVVISPFLVVQCSLPLSVQRSPK